MCRHKLTESFENKLWHMLSVNLTVENIKNYKVIILLFSSATMEPGIAQFVQWLDYRLDDWGIKFQCECFSYLQHHD